jgi:glutathione-regulated potassium-efflux system ancillary protein KefC
MYVLYTFLTLLVAAIIAVPIAKRLGFGSVLGYLAAGLAIGPTGLALITDVEDIAHVSELGVVMLLFLIGLELRPARLWIMRRSVLGLGSAQVGLTSLVLIAVCYGLGLSLAASIVVGFALSLSSTALALPMLAERDLLASHAGRDTFAVLLFQDMAVIPAVALIPLLEGGGTGMASLYEVEIAILRAVGALALVMIGGAFSGSADFPLGRWRQDAGNFYGGRIGRCGRHCSSGGCSGAFDVARRIHGGRSIVGFRIPA